MKLFARVSVFAFAVGIVLSGPASAQVEPIRTRRTEFRIPFAFSQADYARIGAQEVQLFLSVDRGDSWQHVQSALPTAQKFRFRAGSDGEHWFAVRTLDRSGRLRPLGRLAPGLIVLVDTSKPRVNMELVERPGGGVTVHWRTLDADLNLDSLRMEYRLQGSDIWEPVQPEQVPHGQLDIPLPAQIGGTTSEVSVRISVEDRAGNAAQAESTVALPGEVPLKPEPETQPLPPPTNPIPAPGAATVTAVRSAAKETPARPVSLRNERRPAPDIRDSEAAGGLMQIKPAPAIRVTPRRVADVPYETNLPPAAANRSTTAAVAVSAHAVESVEADTAADRAVAVTGEPEAEIQQYAPAPPEPVEEPSAVPVDEPQFISHREFQLGYSIDDLGSSGVGSVEVFITENNGEKWWRYGEDTDRTSPFLVRVPRDGTYGFHVAARSGAGLGGAPPTAGDPPQVVIVVDQSAPRGDLQQVRMDEDGRTLIMNWHARDTNCGKAPIRLEYAASLSGPWQAIGQWLPNTGEFKWLVEQHVPPRIYVRMRMQDAAGNEATVVYPKAVLVDTSKPRVRIIRVQAPVRKGG